MPDTQRQYVVYRHPPTDFFEVGHVAERLPGVVLHRSSALGSGAGRSLLV